MDSKTVSRYELWKNYQELNEELKAELAAADEEDINDRFYKELEFGTAGLRGVIGAGSNRMNLYTVGRATAGFAKYLLMTAGQASIAIAYDSRHKSEFFARETARIMAHYGIKVYLWPELMPTPMLSFAIRYYGCDGGVVVTASHNPAQYNGYKAYGNDGAQLGQEDADMVYSCIQSEDEFVADKITYTYEQGIESGLIELIPQSTFDAFIDACSAQSLADASVDKTVSIAYTPLYGTGLKPVTACLKKNGFTNIHVVEEQASPNGDFPTCPYPNPEIREAMEVGLKEAAKCNADILIATDPDADRIGIAVKDGDDYKLISGNETGILVLDYVCTMRLKNSKMPKDPVAVKTIVSSDMVTKVAADYGVNTYDTITGFKNIGAIVTALANAGQEERYIFGFEESYGYMMGPHVRDKDAVSAALIIAEAFAYFKSQGRSLIDRLEEIYKKYGYYKNETRSYAFPGESGFEKMKDIMSWFRENPPKEVAGFKVLEVQDYLEEHEGLPKSDVLKYILDGFNMAVLRPSGTEPKLKLYTGVTAGSMEEAGELSETIRKDFEAHLT